MVELNQRPERAAGSKRLEQSLRPCFQHRAFPKLQGVFWPGNGKYNHRQAKKFKVFFNNLLYWNCYTYVSWKST